MYSFVKVRSIGKDHATEMKAAKTIAVVIGSFVVCWLPFFVMVVGHAHSAQFPYPIEVFNLIKWMAYLNSALNPVIYAFMNRVFRRAFKRLVTRCWLQQTVGSRRRSSAFSTSLYRRGSSAASRDRGARATSLEQTVVMTLCDSGEESRGDPEQ